MARYPYILNEGIKIYYGRYAELIKEKTEFMSFYVAWDTRSLLIGNRTGEKIVISKGDLTEDKLNKKLENHMKEIESIREKIFEYTDNVDNVFSQKLDESYDHFKSETLQKLTEDMLEIIEDPNSEDNALKTIIVESIDSELEKQLNEIIETLVNHEVLENKYVTKSDPKFDNHWLVNKREYSENDMSYSDISETFRVKNIDVNKLSTLSLNFPGYTTQYKNAITHINDKGIDETNSGNIALYLSELKDDEIAVVNQLIADSDGRVNNSTLGKNTTILGKGTNIGYNRVGSTAIGYNAVVDSDNSVQLGDGTNRTNKSLQFREFPLVGENGRIYEERIEDKYHTLRKEINWNIDDDLTRTLIVEGMTEDAIVWFSPDEVGRSVFINSGIRAVSQGEDKLVIKADSIPDDIFYVNIVWRIPRRVD